MKKVIIVFASLFMMIRLFGQSENRAVEDFSMLHVSDALEVEITQGTSNQVTVTGENPEAISKVTTEVKDGILSVATNGKVKSKENVKVLITVNELKGIEQSGASEIRTTNTLQSSEFNIKGSGAIEANIAVEAEEVKLDFSGASDIKLSGSTENFNLKLSGASDLKASEFIAKHVKINISGASDVKVHATESISGKASGASSINVKGSPSVRNIETSIASSASYNGVTAESVGNVGVNDGNGFNNDTTRIKWGDTKILVINDSIHFKNRRKRRNHWAGVDLGINGFMDAGNSFDLSNPSHFEQSNPQKVTQFMELNYRKSWTFSINFLEFFIKIRDHNFGIVTGMGSEWNNYELKHNIRLTSKGGDHVFPTVTEFNEDYTWGEIDTVLSYDKNRFKTWFLNAPLLLELNTGKNKNKSFHIAAGAIVGLNLQTKIKYKYEDVNGNTQKEKDKQSFNTNPFRVSLTTRMGVGWFNVFATYSLTPLFEDGRGPELYPFTVGVTLLGF